MPSNVQYPSLFTGQRWTATLAASMLPVVSYKAAGTSRASTTTRTADPDLTVDVLANGLYRINFTLFVTCTSTTPGFNFSWSAPASATGWISCSAGDSTTDQHRTFAPGSGGGPSTIVGTMSVLGHGVVDVAGTAGAVAITWAQLVSNAAAVTVEAGSWLELIRME